MKLQRFMSHSKSASHSKSRSKSNSLVNTSLSPLNEANVIRRTTVIHHTPSLNGRVGSHGLIDNTYDNYKSQGAQSRSISDSVVSDNAPGVNEGEHSLSHSVPIPVD